MDQYGPYIPPEILSQIFGYIDPKDKTTFRAIVLCSKLFYHVAIGTLYEKAEFTLNSSVEYKDSRMRSLFLAALENNSLGNRVRHFSVRSKLSRSAVTENKPSRLSLMRSLFLAPFASGSRVETNDPANDHILSELLPMLSNLRILDLEFTCGMPELTNDKLRHSSTLNQLESVVLTYSHPANTYAGPLMIGLLQPPALKYVYLRSVCDVTEDTYFSKEEHRAWSITTIPDKSLKFTHLELRDCEFGPSMCLWLLEACAGLRTFIHDNVQSTELVSAIFDGLQGHKQCLERLWLDGSLGTEWWAGVPMPTLRDFPRLGHLRLSFLLMMKYINFPARYFPESVEVVHITSGQYSPVELSQLLTALLRDIEAAVLPLVKQIKVEYDVPRVYEGPEFVSLIGGSKFIQTIVPRLGVQVSLVASHQHDREAGAGERKWGMDEDKEWATCSDGGFVTYPTHTFSLEQLAWLHAEQTARLLA